ncbi:acyl-CoA dehydrogenase family protein [Acuticoccus kandeliae]|uniref:acyl-CoA dehydrogenase family protein n=1 Tax=Acuticoccus kandeliae TaxID=2073160 RepID=UPI0013007CF9|nr:acyl-CoA dehydrogenase family protein [Acuticoccus kandeliae]
MHKTMDETLRRRAGLRRGDEADAGAARMPDYAGVNAYASDPVLGACLDPTLDEAMEEDLRSLGAYWGSSEAQEVARIATAHGPTLRPYDFDGRRIDQVEIHPAYHALMNRSVLSGLLSATWEEGEDRRQHRLRAATLFLTAQCERGHLVPVCATHACVAALAYAPDLEAELFPLIASRKYDRRAIPLEEKSGATITLALGEQGAALDRSTVAMKGEIVTGDRLKVTGEKWFVAAPTADLALVLCRTPEGPTAAMVPRFAPENVDAIRVNQLQNVGGLAAQAVANVAFDGAMARLIGEPGRGLQVLRDVRTLTQLDLAVMAAGAMRAAVARAAHGARYRQSFGRTLIAHPLHARVLADLALESAAHTALAMRLAGAFDQAFERDGDHALARLVTPAARIYALKSAPAFLAEARDSLGDNAFAESHPAARIAGDLAVLGQWDGSANEAALEIAALVERDPTVLGDALQEIGADLGNQNGDILEDVARLGERAAGDAALARVFAEQLAMLAAAAAMRRNLPRVVSDAYIASRLRERHRVAFGALDGRFDADAIIEFVVPEG